MGDAVIVSAARTAIGTARKGTLLDVTAFDLAKESVGEALKRSGIPADDVDDLADGREPPGRRRHRPLRRGRARSHQRPRRRAQPALRVGHGRGAGRGRQHPAGMDTVVIAGGAESISTSPSSMKRVHGHRRHGAVDVAEPPRDAATRPRSTCRSPSGWNTAQKANVTREEMDFWAYESHRRGGRGDRRGSVRGGDLPARGEAARRRDRRSSRSTSTRAATTTMEKLASLNPLHPEIEGFSITAGNSSGLNDGAAAMVLVDSRLRRRRTGSKPLAVVQVVGVGGRAARRHRASARRTRSRRRSSAPASTVEDVDLFEINEAFASMCVASTRILGIPHEITNVSGSGCSIGHPVAATGARMIVTLVHELRRRGGGIGVASMCAGGGMGSATVIEVLKP